MLSKLSDRCPSLFKGEFCAAWTDGDSSKGSEQAVIELCGGIWLCCPSGHCHRSGSAVPEQQTGECSFIHLLTQPQPCVNGLLSVCKILAVLTLNKETRNLSVILGVLYTSYYQETPERKANFPPFIHPCSDSFSKQLKDRILQGFLSLVRKEKFMSSLGLVSY